VRIFGVLLLMTISTNAFNQADQLHFKSIRKGLSNQFVRCILKDSKGFMWFGTQNGLTRYDGVNFVVYENSTEDSTSLSYNNITAIFEDKNKNLWVSTFLGLNLYNREKDNFIRISAFQSIVISTIGEDNQNNLWLGTIGSGVIRYNLSSKKVDYFTNTGTDINSINSNHITSLLVDRENKLWFGTWYGLFLMDTDGKVIKHFLKEPHNAESLSDNYVNTLTIAKDSVLWIGTLYGGLNKLFISDQKFRFTHYLSKSARYTPPSILSMVADHHTSLWIGIENSGLLRLDTKTGQFDHYLEEAGNLYTLNSNLIRSLYIDNLNILWIGTIGKGVNYIDQREKRFDLYKRNPDNPNSVSGDDIRCFTEDKQGNIWIGTYDGISMFDSKNRQFIRRLTQETNNLTSNAVNSLAFDSKDNLWIGTMNQGIDQYNRNLTKIGNYKIKGIQKVGENKINTLYVDRKDNLWVGTAGSGLFRYDNVKNTFIQIYNDPKGAGPNEMGYVFSVLETSDSLIWIATAHRLFCLEDSSDRYSFRIFANDTSPGSLNSNYIVCLFEDHNKNLWIGSMDQGLFLYDKANNSFKNYRVRDGLPGNSILGILEDNFGDLWISTTKGISRFNVTTKNFTNYNAEDGLISDEFNMNSCWKNRHGLLLFGSGEGFNCFYPENIRVNPSVQSVRITDFKIFNQSIRIQFKNSPLTKNIGETRKIVLKNKQSSFSVEFVALNYIQGSKSQYSYILEGLEENWNVVNNKISATYSYVRPGKYLFKVLGSNNDGIWNNTPATLEIVVLPPWWKSKLAFVVYFLMFITIITIFIRYRIGIVKQAHLAELNQMKLQFLANISHELRTPLSLIISPVENLYSRVSNNPEIKTQLDHIYQNANRLFRLVNELLDFSRIVENKLSISVQKGDIVKFIKELSDYYNDEAARRQINYHFEAEPERIEAWFDPDKIEKIILNLLSNSFKFTWDGGRISIKIAKISLHSNEIPEKMHMPKSSSEELLKITVTDNGTGIMPADLDRIFERFYQGKGGNFTHQTGSGIGLSLVKSLVELHHGKIYAGSEVEKETCFTILLPLGSSHFKKSEINLEPVEIKSKGKDLKVSIKEISGKEKKHTADAPTVLLVEDNFELRKYISAALSSGFRIIEAGNGETGYKLAVENPPDLIISDIIMPVMNGIELCQQIKSNIITSHIPVVLLTSKTTLDDKISGIETGADAYITKPFSMIYLESVTRNLIDTRKKIFQRFSQEVYLLPKEMAGNTLDQDLLEKIIKYVEENIAKTDLTVEELAAFLLMSPGHTWRKVKALTGMTTNEFVRALKLKKAIKFMEDGNHSISEIAYKVGFSSPAYFTKCFKEQYGRSPSSYLSQKIAKN
jgi:signal transduction histidine kinase/ligand-binding sensor domain-containing protein/DNA-binding response OmpR family regulator